MLSPPPNVFFKEQEISWEAEQLKSIAAALKDFQLQNGAKSHSQQKAINLKSLKRHRFPEKREQMNLKGKEKVKSLVGKWLRRVKTYLTKLERISFKKAIEIFTFFCYLETCNVADKQI